MNVGHERQWLLVVLVCVSLLTLFTANGLPLLDQDAGFGIRDDPAENQVLSLSERDVDGDGSLSNVAGLAESSATNTTANTTNTSARPELHMNMTKSPKPLNNSGLNITADVLNEKNLTTTASPQNISINATRTGNITRLASNQSSPVNILINASQTVKFVAKNSSGSSLSTYTNSLKPSPTRTPSGSSLKLSAIGSPSVSLNPSQSAAILTNPAAGVSSVVATSVSSNSLLFPSATRLPSTQGPQQNISLSTKNSTGAVSTQSTSPNNKTQIPSTQSSSGAPSSQGTSSSLSTQNPSTKGTTEVSSTQKTQADQSTRPASTKSLITTKLSTAPSTGVVSSLPPTTEVKTPESTTNNVISEKPSTKMSTQESTRKPSTQASEKPSTKQTSIAPSTKKALSTVPKEPTTNAKIETTKKAAVKKATTKKATTKPVVSEKKTTAVKTKANNENNDEGKMPPPDQGREAVLWDFIVPVAVGTGVALAIAFGVILVRTCRRRKLIKVRFGGKPSHPRLLNNDLINLLAESDDEEE